MIFLDDWKFSVFFLALTVGLPAAALLSLIFWAAHAFWPASKYHTCMAKSSAMIEREFCWQHYGGGVK